MSAYVSFDCTIHLYSNKFAMGVKIKATGDLKLNDSPEYEAHIKANSCNIILIVLLVWQDFTQKEKFCLQFLSMSIVGV